MRPWTFTNLTKEHHDETRDLILAGLEEHWGSFDPTLNPDLDDMLMSYRDGHTVIALADDTVVGTGTLAPLDPTTVEIVRMSVIRAHRRSGLGRSIVEELCRRALADGHRRVILETTSSWTGIVAFYLSCGFTVTHVEAGAFGDDTWFARDLTDSA